MIKDPNSNVRPTPASKWPQVVATLAGKHSVNVNLLTPQCSVSFLMSSCQTAVLRRGDDVNTADSAGNFKQGSLHLCGMKLKTDFLSTSPLPTGLRLPGLH